MDDLSKSNLQLQEMREELRGLKEEKKDLFEIALAFKQDANFNQTLKKMDEQKEATIYAMIFGVILGGILTYGVHLLLEKREAKKLRGNMQHSLKIEIKDNLTKLENTSDILRELKKDPKCNLHLAFELKNPYRKECYNAHIRDLVLLGEETLRKISELYYNYSILDNAEPILYTIFEEGYSEKAPFHKIFFEDFVEKVKEATELSNELIENFEPSKM
jgi:translation initiation factor 2 beta subunit (eIF-2beta)/eIF-5